MFVATTQVHFQSLLTPAEVEKDFCSEYTHTHTHTHTHNHTRTHICSPSLHCTPAPGSYLRPTLFTTPITASASASNVWDALHLLLGSAPAEEEGKSPALAHMLASLGEPKTSPHLASLIHQVARAYGKVSGRDEDVGTCSLYCTHRNAPFNCFVCLHAFPLQTAHTVVYLRICTYVHVYICTCVQYI